MQDQAFNRLGQTLRTSWPGTHEAKAACLRPHRDGEDYPLPVSVPAPVAISQPFGTVVMLCHNPNLVAQLRQSLMELNVLTQQYFSWHTILADTMPVGPACLIIELDGEAPEGLESYKQLRAKGWRLPIIVLIGNPEIRTVVQLMRAGAEDVLLKSCEPAELLAAINSALRGSRKEFHHRCHDGGLQCRMDLLTMREGEIIRLVLAGMLNKQIADRLRLALVTVKVHRAKAMRKLGARNAAELARLTLMTTELPPADFTSDLAELPPPFSCFPAD